MVIISLFLIYYYNKNNKIKLMMLVVEILELERFQEKISLI